MTRLNGASRKLMEVKGRSCVSYTTMLLGNRTNPVFDSKNDINRSVK